MRKLFRWTLFSRSSASLKSIWTETFIVYSHCVQFIPGMNVLYVFCFVITCISCICNILFEWMKFPLADWKVNVISSQRRRLLSFFTAVSIHPNGALPPSALQCQSVHLQSCKSLHNKMRLEPRPPHTHLRKPKAAAVATIFFHSVISRSQNNHLIITG